MNEERFVHRLFKKEPDDLVIRVMNWPEKGKYYYLTAKMPRRKSAELKSRMIPHVSAR